MVQHEDDITVNLLKSLLCRTKWRERGNGSSLNRNQIYNSEYLSYPQIWKVQTVLINSSGCQVTIGTLTQLFFL